MTVQWKLKSVQTFARVAIENADPEPVGTEGDLRYVPDYLEINWVNGELFGMSLSGFVLKRDGTPGTRRHKPMTSNPQKFPTWAVRITQKLIERHQVKP